MAKDLFSNLDLNLLRTFIILHQERNMRKASERLFVSQPAISKALQRLRDHFSDELFVKTHHGLRATEYANQLAESIAPILDELSSTLNESNEFDPKKLDGVIKLALSPFILSAIANKLFQAIRTEAPNVQVQLLNWSKSTMTDIINNEVQLGLNYEISHAPKELIQKPITQDRFTGYVRKDHPYKGTEIEVKDGVNFELATVIAVDWNSHQSLAEKILKIRGLEANIGFRSELPSAVIDVIHNSDMMFPASKFLEIDNNHQLRSLKILFDNQDINPKVCAYYHHKNRNNPTMLWLKNILNSLLIDNP
ncbi:LysR family transcriptional regulator [Aliivibrio fischeri]|uniref:LysR family transcriptional regulator n=1 Tax=Aliivibrio fischeri TaxID=668 RepID=UPI0007C5B1A0|nr:LysR family transcriptional regulator [Aliivibrio fischeri]MCE7554455.1 LysR family transcriptional regulator [Aliivibrio fischeri]MCE7561723.1 LysR family transcriptional regulator [Aliivibrio fischeri]MCE7569131.1 LysR family transcriptional regulator [Aliivibrio fischeri]MCE7576668.1 LysR family transcriptional regulator [Aliivibrio fischeri]MCE7589210.1 LysR family transcriptional regulator [Aliivibrio fischeri]